MCGAVSLVLFLAKDLFVIISEPLIPTRVQNPQCSFPFCDTVFFFQKRAPCLRLERTRWGSSDSATRQMPSRAPRRCCPRPSPGSRASVCLCLCARFSGRGPGTAPGSSVEALWKQSRFLEWNSRAVVFKARFLGAHGQKKPPENSSSLCERICCRGFVLSLFCSRESEKCWMDVMCLSLQILIEF